MRTELHSEGPPATPTAQAAEAPDGVPASAEAMAARAAQQEAKRVRDEKKQKAAEEAKAKAAVASRAKLANAFHAGKAAGGGTAAAEADDGRRKDRSRSPVDKAEETTGGPQEAGAEPATEVVDVVDEDGL